MNKMSTTNQLRRRAFTLLELPLVVSLLAVIASLSVGVLAQAQNDAAIAATRSRMTLIEKILEVELENYEVVRSPVSFAGIQTLIGASSLTPGNTLLHAKNLKRMIIADLIRGEMPDGSISGAALGQFPSDSLLAYFGSINIPAVTVNAVFPPTPPSVSTWGSDPRFVIPIDSQIDEVDEGAANKSEILYQVLLNIDVDGVPAIDSIAPQAIGDTDGDSVLEILDAWGEPLYLQWQQENVSLPNSPPTTADFNANIWASNEMFHGLSKEHTNAGFTTLGEYSKPVLPTQIRPFLISARLLEVDALPVDYLPGHRF